MALCERALDLEPRPARRSGPTRRAAGGTGPEDVPGTPLEYRRHGGGIARAYARERAGHRLGRPMVPDLSRL